MEGNPVSEARAKRELVARSSTIDDESVAELQREFKTSTSQRNLLDHTFDMLDFSKNDILDRFEISALLSQAASHVGLKVQQDVIDDAVEALIEDTYHNNPDENKTMDHITRDQFIDIFHRHPDMMAVFRDKESMRNLRASVKQRRKSKIHDNNSENTENEEVFWVLARAIWRDSKVPMIWLTLIVLANITAFTYKGVKYNRDEEAQAVFGNCVVVARGCANCLNLNTTIVLIPILRHFQTWLRNNEMLKSLFPFDLAIDHHQWFGLAVCVFAIGHVFAHICDIHRFAHADIDDIDALFGNKLGTIPDSPSGRWLLLLGTRAAVTGIIMVVCMIAAGVAILGKSKNFNRFLTLHHLFLVMLVAMCYHGTGNLLEPFKSVYFVGVPLLLYFVPRLYRELRGTRVKVLDVNVKRGNVVALKLEKPKSWENYVKAGMYSFLNVPAVSRLEWHPFTLTSCASDDFIEFNFAVVGDWTTSVHDYLKAITEGAPPEEPEPHDTESGEKEAPKASTPTISIKDVIIKVDGPMGASSQGFSNYPILVLVGAGIGVTPMISVLRQLIVTPGKMKRVFFYWTVRDTASFKWFNNIMDDIYEKDTNNKIQIRHFLTSAKEDDRDLGAVLLHHATRARHRRTNFDLILGQQTHHQLQVGRPNWKEELESVRLDGKQLGEDRCGVFLCGPVKMAEALDETCFDLSTEDPDFHFYFTKETF